MSGADAAGAPPRGGGGGGKQRKKKKNTWGNTGRAARPGLPREPALRAGWSPPAPSSPPRRAAGCRAREGRPLPARWAPGPPSPAPGQIPPAGDVALSPARGRGSAGRSSRAGRGGDMAEAAGRSGGCRRPAGEALPAVGVGGGAARVGSCGRPRAPGRLRAAVRRGSAAGPAGGGGGLLSQQVRGRPAAARARRAARGLSFLPSFPRVSPTANRLLRTRPGAGRRGGPTQ